MEELSAEQTRRIASAFGYIMHLRSEYKGERAVRLKLAFDKWLGGDDPLLLAIAHELNRLIPLVAK